MQTVFLVWFPGLAALFVGSAIGIWITSKAYLMFRQARAIKGRDNLLLDSAGALKEVSGTENFNLLPSDLQERVQRKVYEIETTTHRQL